MDLTTKETDVTTSGFNLTNQKADDNSVLGAIYLAVSLLVMTTNSIVVFIIANTRELHQPTLWAVAHMAAWDFLYGLAYLVLVVPSAFLNTFAYGERFIGWASSVLILIVGQNLLNTAMVVVDRYIALKFPLKYPRISTKRNYILAVFLSYLVNVCRLLITILPGLEFRYSFQLAVCLSEFNTVGGQFASLTLMGITFIVIILLSSVLFIGILRDRRRIRAGGSSGPSESMLKFTLMVTLTAGIYCSAYLPAVVAAVLYFIYKGENNPEWLTKISMVAILSNSLWNVFIYTITYQPFKDSLLATFCKAYHRRRMQAEVLATFRKQSRNEEVTHHL